MTVNSLLGEPEAEETIEAEELYADTIAGKYEQFEGPVTVILKFSKENTYVQICSA